METGRRHLIVGVAISCSLLNVFNEPMDRQKITPSFCKFWFSLRLVAKIWNHTFLTFLNFPPELLCPPWVDLNSLRLSFGEVLYEFNERNEEFGARTSNHLNLEIDQQLLD